MSNYKTSRNFMKSDFAESVHDLSDQANKVPYPPLQKPLPEGEVVLIDLPKPNADLMHKPGFHRLLLERQSRRKFTKESLSLDELSYLLWATQGVIVKLGQGYASRRPVPSGGARHAFETYLAINRVEDLEPGIYRYLPFSHQLYFQEPAQNLPALLTEANLGQKFVGNAAAVFAWSCIPYRAEWRYMGHSHKNLLLDAGHVCQNLYLAVEALGLGTCAIGAYDQAGMDALLELDGEDEYIIYLAPVGKV